MFDLIRSWRRNTPVLCAVCRFEDRKVRFAGLLPKSLQGIALNQYFAGDSAVIFEHAAV